jgi:branched-chain amino acid transport system substrate-binding protein
MKKCLSTFLMFFIALSLLSGCEKKPETLKIGVAGPMTGPEAKMGTDFRNAATLAVEEWNAKGGVLGKKIELAVGDDQSDPKQAVSVANKLVNEGVVAVVGHFNSSCSIPASDVYSRAALPMITPGSTNPQLTERGHRSVFRVCGRDDQQGLVGAAFVTRKLNLKKVAVLHDKTTYGQGLAEEFRKNLGSAVQTTYFGGITKGDKDFKTVLTSVRQGGPELIFFGGIYPEGGLLVKQAREINLSVPFMSGDGCIDPKFIEIAGAAAAEGTYLTFGPDPNNIPAAKDFLAKYKARFGEPGPYSIYAYDAVTVLLHAVVAAGTAKGDAVIGKLHSMEFPVSLGILRFTEKGDVSSAPYIVWVTRSGKFEEYWKP